MNQRTLNKSCGLLFFAASLLTTSKARALTSGDICFDSIHTANKNINTEREDICLRVNKERSSRAYAKLELDPILSKVAQRYAEEMAQGNFFDHVTPKGETFRSRLVKEKVNYRRAGENIARGQDTPAVVHVQWMKSEGHRRNIMTPAFRKIGVGSYKKYWVQVFTD